MTRCPKCGRTKKRSSEANRRYWMLVYMIADKLKPEGKQHSAEVWHTYFKQRFIGVDEFEMPNHKTMLIPKSSTDLDTAEFNDFMMKVEVWAGEHGVWLDEVTA